MRAEYRVTKIHPVTGRRQQVWVCPSGNNHLFDCSAEQIVAATLLKILPDEIQMEKSQESPKSEVPSPTPE